MGRAKFKDLAARLTWARSASGLTAYALSLKASLSKTHVAMIENHKRVDIEVATAQAIATVLGISWVWLLAGEGEPPTEAQIKKAVAGAA